METFKLAVRIAFWPLVVHLALVVMGMGLGFLFVPKAPPWGKADYEPLVEAAPRVLQGLLRWDAHWYTSLAAHGYIKANSVFFPLLPALASMLSRLSGLSIPTAGLLITNLCSVACLVLLAHLALGLFAPNKAKQVVWAFALFPTSFYVNAFYTESLFVLCVLASLLSFKQDKYLWGGCWAALATLARNTGAGLILFLLAQVLIFATKKKGSLLKLGHIGLAIGLPLCALAAFMAYQYAVLGDALAFIHSQARWGRTLCLPWQGIWHTLHLIFAQHGALHLGSVFLWLNLSLTLWALGMLGLLGVQVLKNRLMVPYLFFGAALLIVPLLSTHPADPLMSLPRYVLVNIPCFLAIGYLPKRVFLGLGLAFGLGLLVCMALFARCWWLA